MYIRVPTYIVVSGGGTCTCGRGICSRVRADADVGRWNRANELRHTGDTPSIVTNMSGQLTRVLTLYSLTLYSSDFSINPRLVTFFSLDPTINFYSNRSSSILHVPDFFVTLYRVFTTDSFASLQVCFKLFNNNAETVIVKKSVWSLRCVTEQSSKFNFRALL